jgi:hypothetical protein
MKIYRCMGFDAYTNTGTIRSVFIASSPTLGE